jgi:acyl-CoA thioester hydrolase
MTAPFRFRLRVRYSECDAQGIVFNARWGDYIDLAVAEYTRAVFDQDFEWRLVKQTIEWRSPARYDDVLEIAVQTVRVGTTSFTIRFEMSRAGTHLASAETVYVFVDNAANLKRPIPESARAALERGAAGILVDQSAASR